MWRICKEASRPWPVISDDPVIDYMVMEAVALKVRREDDKARKDQERRQAQRDAAKRLVQEYG